MHTLDTHISWMSGSLSVGQAGNHTVTIDRPESVGGTDAGFRASELFLLSIGACLTNNLIAAAQARNIVLTKLETHVSAVEASHPKRFDPITLSVDLDGTRNGIALTVSERDLLLLVTERGCGVLNSLRSDTTTLNVTLVKNPVVVLQHEAELLAVG